MTTLPDAAARERIRTELDTSFVVRAGAGAGKTTLLVERAVAVAARDGWRSLAVVTFSRRAAEELRHRIREKVPADTDGLDETPIETLHAFALRIVRRWGVRIGIPPAVRLEDEDDVRERAAERTDRWLERVTANPRLADVLGTALEAGLAPNQLRGFVAEWEERRHRWSGRDLPPTGGQDPIGAEIEIRMEELYGQYREAADRDPTDKLVEKMPAWFRAWEEESPMPPLGSGGTKKAWPSGAKEFRDRLKEAVEDREVLGRAKAYDRCRSLLRLLVAGVRDDARRRLRAGTITHHDALVAARDLLKDPAIAAEVARCWPVLFLDEAQDTDPLQLEIAASLARTHGAAGGRLFLVGDPQQAIYGFRGADPKVMEEALDPERMKGCSPAEELRLTVNFRSHPDILDWVNRGFSAVMTEELQGRAYQILDRAPEKRFGDCPAGRVRPRIVPLASSNDPKRHDLVADATVAAIRELETAVDRRDIAVLIPTRTGLPALERAFRREGVPYRLEARTLLLASDEARDLRALAGALVDPDDPVAVVAALTTPALSVTDDELAAWVRERPERPFAYLHHADGPGFAALREWREAVLPASRNGAAAALSCLVRLARIREIHELEDRPRDAWRRTAYVLDLARTYDAVKGGTLRGFLASLDTGEEEGLAHDVPVPAERDDDAVRILTIHASKGLEFPAVVLSGTGNPSGRPDRGCLLESETGGPMPAWPEIAPLGSGEARIAAQKRARAEEMRVLYVGLTRARHYLAPVFVSPPPPSKKSADPDAGAPWVRFVRANPELLEERSDALLAKASAPEPGLPVPPESPEAIRARLAAIRETAFLPTASPSGTVKHLKTLAEIDRDDAGMEEDAPEFALRTGAGGTSLGRAVHAVMERIGWDGDGLEEAVALHAAAEGTDPELVTRLARAGAEWARTAVQGREVREMFLSAEIDGVLTEGFVDLFWRDGAGDYHLADWKTDRAETPADIATAMEGYRIQAGAYALMCERRLGRRPKSMTFVFLRALSNGRPGAVHTVAPTDDLIREAARGIQAAGRTR